MNRPELPPISADVKRQAALLALDGKQDIEEIAARFGCLPDEVEKWRDQLLEASEQIFIQRELGPWLGGDDAFHTQLAHVIAENSTVGLAIIDENGYCRYSNQAFQKMTGYSEEDFHSRTLHDLVHHHYPTGAPYPAQDCSIVRTLATKERMNSEEQMLFRKDGSSFWVLCSASPVFWKGTAIGTVIEVRDITSHRQIQQVLSNTETRLALALAAGKMGAWEWHVKTDGVVWLHGASEVHGLPTSVEPVHMSMSDYATRYVYPEDMGSLHAAMADVLANGELNQAEYRVIWPDGSLHWIEVRGQLYLDENRQPSHVVGVSVDITRRRRAQEDLSFLARASAELAGLENKQATLEKVAFLAVPQFADWCAIDLLDDSGELKRMAVAHVNPDKVALMHEVYRRFPTDLSQPRGIANIIRSGKSDMVRVITDEILEASVLNEEYRGYLKQLGFRSYIGVPLVAHGRMLGAATFICAESGRVYTPEDLTLAEDLARRAAIAIENANLYQQLQMSSKRLEVSEQEALTAARLAEEERMRLNALLEAAPVGIAMVDVQGKVVRANTNNRQIWGDYPLSANTDNYVDCNGWWADGSDKDGRKLQSNEWALARALRGEEPRDIVDIEPLGSPGTRRTIFLSGAPIFDGSGSIVGAVVAQMDITGTVKAEKALRESEAKFRSITNAVPQIVWSARPDGYVDYWNQQWYDFTGVPNGSTDGEGWEGIVHADDIDRTWTAWKYSLGTGESYEIEYRLRHHSGRYRWTLGRALPVRDDRGNILRWMGTCTDIHEQTITQEALRQSDRRKDEFLAMLAHELRNPLAPIAAAADLLKLGQFDEERVRNLSEVVSRQTQHMTGLIEDLLDVSRVTRGLVVLEKIFVDIKSVVAEAVEQVRPLVESRAHHLETHISPEHVLVSGDKKRLVQVLTNLLNNAAKYTPNGGHIVLRMEADADQVILCVSDNGIGMSESLTEEAFELFAQAERTSDRSQGGLGIGLALVKHLVQLHGGTVTAYSQGAGQGSELTVVLPRVLHDEKHRLLIADAPSVIATSSALRILVVDDNADAANVLGMLLEAMGYRVFLEFGARKALDTARVVQPHICLLDIGLPDMDGHELARQLRLLPEAADAVLVAITGYGQPQDKELALAAGFNHHFVKPVDSAALTAFLAEVKRT